VSLLVLLALAGIIVLLLSTLGDRRR